MFSMYVTTLQNDGVLCRIRIYADVFEERVYFERVYLDGVFWLTGTHWNRVVFVENRDVLLLK